MLDVPGRVQTCGDDRRFTKDVVLTTEMYKFQVNNALNYRPVITASLWVLSGILIGDYGVITCT